MFLAACVSALLVSWNVPAAALPPLQNPLRVRFQLSDGIRVAGQMTSCDNEGFDGTFGRRQWTELDASD